jgi:peptidoglycan/LPS O-acetylase OafA/YrhL
MLGMPFFSIFRHPIHLTYLSYFDKDFHAVIYSVIILNVATNKKTLINLEYPIFNFLGRISYGIYVYHFIVLFLISLPLRHVLPYMESEVLKRSLTFGSEIVGTIFIAYLSYSYFETWFLAKKKNFVLIKSTNEIKESVSR